MQATMRLEDSSCISGFHYDFNEHTLELEFVGERRYRYQVEPLVFAHFLLAESKGQFFNGYIKKLPRC